MGKVTFIGDIHGKLSAYSRIVSAIPFKEMLNMSGTGIFKRR